MKINIVILSANNEIAVRNTEAQRNTFIKHIFEQKRKNDYKVFFYEGDNSEIEEVKLSENVYDIKCASNDDIKHTFEKTCEAYDYIIKHYPSDLIVRANISCYINIDLLDNIAQEIYDNGYIIANRVNTILNAGKFMNYLYPRGDFYIVRTDLVEKALQNMEGLFDENNFEVDSVDDTKFGVCLWNADKEKYVNRLHCCKYKLMVYEGIESFSKNTLSFRLKTINKNEHYTGYSWNDIEARKYDSEKMHKLYNLLNKYHFNSEYYKNTKLEDVIIPDNDIDYVYLAQIYQNTLSNAKIKFIRNQK